MRSHPRRTEEPDCLVIRELHSVPLEVVSARRIHFALSTDELAPERFRLDDRVVHERLLATALAISVQRGRDREVRDAVLRRHEANTARSSVEIREEQMPPLHVAPERHRL